MDSHQFLDFRSAHLFHNKKINCLQHGITYQKALLISTDFTKHLENLKTWFCNTEYPHKLADAQIKRVSEKSLDEVFI